MPEINNLFDLANEIGFEAIDSEIAAWIEIGEFDEQVIERATKLGWIPPNSKWWDIDKEDEPLF